MRLTVSYVAIVLAILIILAPPGAAAQEAGKVYQVAIVHPVRRVADMTEGGDQIYRAFFSELRRLGYVEGKNLVVERRSAEGLTGRYPELTREVVQLRPHLAAHGRLPVIYPFRDFATAGGLMVYGFDVADLWLGVARYVDRILKGANPGELPYQQPTKFELVINVKTARALGLTIPQSLLLRADDEVTSVRTERGSACERLPNTTFDRTAGSHGARRGRSTCALGFTA